MSPSFFRLALCGTRYTEKEVWHTWFCSTAGRLEVYLREALDTRQHFSNATCKCCPSEPLSVQIFCRLSDHLQRYSSNNQGLSFCLPDSVCIISKFASQDLLDSAHLHSNSFHVSYNLDIISSMKTVKLHKQLKKEHSVLLSNHLSVGVNCTSTCAEKQSPDSLIQYWLSRLRRTFTCHLFSPRPRELTVSLKKANIQ